MPSSARFCRSNRTRKYAKVAFDDFRVDCELCRHWGLSRRTGAKQNCAGGVEERRGRSRFFAGAKQNGAGAKQNGGGEEEGVSWGCPCSIQKNLDLALSPPRPEFDSRRGNHCKKQEETSFTASGGTTPAFGRDTLGGGHQQAGR
ncbi:hypothetical protein Bbelb_052810 [Branchiostoma belcheri]|nr:hypothetical protein Bbelb_052810 [Branchiostoma belcheri]